MLHAKRFPCPALPATGLSKDSFQLTLATVCQKPMVLVPGRRAEQYGVPREAQWASGNHRGTGVPRHCDLQPGHIGDISWVAHCWWWDQPGDAGQDQEGGMELAMSH